MPATPPTPPYPPSESGNWEVKISRVWEHASFYYKPSMSRIVVDETTLNLMLAETDLVANVVAAD